MVAFADFATEGFGAVAAVGVGVFAMVVLSHQISTRVGMPAPAADRSAA